MLAALAVHGAAAGGDSTVTVNSTANIDDGACAGPPNDEPAGNCTLREAILEVNAGHATVINFHPPVFAEEQPGVIELCADGSAGELPSITRDVTIDATGSAVVLDGGTKNAGCLTPAAVGIAVTPQEDGLDFTLIGSESFWIRDLSCLTASTLAGGGIVVGPSGFSGLPALGTIEISAVFIENVCEQGILIVGSNLERLALSNTDISSNDKAGVQLTVDPCLGALDCELRDSTLTIRGNRLRGGERRPPAAGGDEQGDDVYDSKGDPHCCFEGSGIREVAHHVVQRWAGIEVSYTGALNGTILANINQNELLSGTANGVHFSFLGCGVDSEIILHIDENVHLSGGDLDGVDVSLLADACAPGGVQRPDGGTSRNLSIVVSVNGNGDVDFRDDVQSRGINFPGGQGVDIGIAICCEEGGSSATLEVNDNARIKGQVDGVEVDTSICCGDGNLATMSVSGNGEVTGDDGTGVRLEFHPGTPVELTMTDNRFSHSAEDGIKIVGGAFVDEDAGIKSVISNNVIEGNGDDGIDIESGWALNIGPGNQIFQNGTDAGGNGIEIDWCLGAAAWFNTGDKLPANGNRILRNAIYDNAGLGIDLVGWDADGAPNCAGVVALEVEGVVGCVPFPASAISPNDCLSFPELHEQAGDKLVGTACSLCAVEVFWSGDVAAAEDLTHGEGAEYLVSGNADKEGNFSILLPCGLAEGLLTTTATDAQKNTSEFSASLPSPGTSGDCVTTPVPADTPGAPPTETPVPPTPSPEAHKLCGDPNEDGVVNAIDATLILQRNAGLLESLADESSADVNSSGDVTSVDATLILQFIAGLIREDGLACL
ncbi:MAG: right-handed parallel beta-helix repeat-containing protein [Chloroflexi bacterium]|nr:right-handed parallel beta-helix repeat-containing protein [Chloroflexota bacterium]